MKSAGLVFLLVGLLALSAIVPSVSAKDKPGRCPPSPAVIKPPCQKLCKGDNTCPGAKKCCNMMCSMVCVDPDFSV
ncbi:omwaprin-a-like [Rhineura floridana]|uniref:omwaprin-a-like n=1 Tax=Rhineura floridana TaxID=261503 RepID=UPI002AC838DF|nr:omwaprin-a-like [Rhineura floridana]